MKVVEETFAMNTEWTVVKKTWSDNDYRKFKEEMIIFRGE